LDDERRFSTAHQTKAHRNIKSYPVKKELNVLAA
jgi:hypothetical protein